MHGFSRVFFDFLDDLATCLEFWKEFFLLRILSMIFCQPVFLEKVSRGVVEHLLVFFLEVIMLNAVVA